jgi:uncharacterized protein YkwD
MELIVVAFVLGFAGTQYFSYVNYRHLADTQRAKSTPIVSPSVQTVPKPAPAAQVSPAPRGTESSVSHPPSSWLRRLNYWRSITNLRTVVENGGLSDGARKHSRYLVKRAIQDDTGWLVGADMHSEDPRNPWYTAAGLAAGKNGDVDPPCRGCQLISDDQHVDIFVNAPFHRFRALDPDADQVGYGSYSEAAMDAATLNVPLSAVGQGTFSAPIEFPAPGSIVPLSAFQGEWPDPLASCPGYKEPAGLAVTLELGRWITVTSAAHSFSQGNKIIASCLLDAPSYTNADQQMREFVRDILKTWGAVIVIPREPLTSGTDYSISITANDKDYKWSFTVE